MKKFIIPTAIAVTLTGIAAVVTVIVRRTKSTK